jgi:membrane-associated phospholipid phosphatase
VNDRTLTGEARRSRPGVDAAFLLPLALLVGFSRVRLGVHYPSDVLVGQLIALCTAVGVFSVL